MRLRPATDFALATIFVLALWLSVPGSGHAQHAGPFARLAGQWTGGGTLDLSDGKRERIKCRAAYDVPTPKSAVLSIRCASESYNFEIRSNVTHAAGAVTGTWSESATMTGGDLSGHVSGGHINVTARSPNFTASMSLVTHGNHQSVVIRSKDPQSHIKGVSISLRRG
jgi:hypothetical protein